MKILSTLAVALIVCCATSAQADEENPLEAFAGQWGVGGTAELVDTVEIFVNKKGELRASVHTKTGLTIGVAGKGLRLVETKHADTVKSIDEFRYKGTTYQFVFTMAGENSSQDLGSFTAIAQQGSNVTVTVDNLRRTKAE